MVFTNVFIVTTALIAVTCADYNWPFYQGQMPGYNAFQNFGLNLPKPLPLPNFNFQSYPQVPQFDVSKMTSGPGQTFSGISVLSSSSVKRDKDGKLIRNGGGFMMTNDNGVIHRYDIGDSSP